MNSRPKRGKAMALAIVCAVLSAGALHAFAQQTQKPTTQTPNLIVYARTDLANQGAPTLDLLDLERYFGQTLTARAISANVVSSSMARIPTQPASRFAPYRKRELQLSQEVSLSKSNDSPIEGEIVTKEQLDRILGRSREPDIPQLEAMLSRFEQLLDQALKTLDLDATEGWCDAIFGRMDHRIAVKMNRGQAIYGLVETFASTLDQFEIAEKKIRALNREHYEIYIDRIRAARTALEEQQKLESVAINARHQLALEAARVNAEIAAYAALAEGSRRSALPPPPPPPPPEDPRAKNKARVAGEIDRLFEDKREEIRQVTEGKPKSEWSDEVTEQVVQIENMYEDAIQEKRDQLRRYL